MPSQLQAAAEMRKALQIFLATMDADADMAAILEVPTMFPVWQPGKSYKAKEVFSYGVNGVGDPQLYQVLQDVTAAAEHTPDAATSLYKPIGVTADGYPEWVQPLGATDAYNAGDVVSYNGALYVSTVDANTWAPDVYGWEAYEG